MQFHIKSCSVFFDKIEFVVLLIVCKFEYNFEWILLHYKNQKGCSNQLQLVFELVYISLDL